MNLYTLINTIKTIASNMPNVGFVHNGDIYELNKRQDIDYPAVVITQTSHTNNIGEDYEIYGLNIFAIDRLTSDDKNRLDIQSWADQLLRTIVSLIEEYNLGIIIGDVIIQPFTERFESLCAGCYATVQIQINTTNCDGDLYLISGGCGDIPEIHDTDPLTFVRVDNSILDGVISIINNGVTNTKTFEYNKNDTGWITYTVGDTIPMSYGDKVQFRSNNTTAVSTDTSAYRYFKTKGIYNCGGNLASLMDNNTTIQLPTNCFQNLFNFCNIINAPVLPWNNINSYCYSNMFYGCTLLVNAPELPATTIAIACYDFMFYGCTSLVTAPELPATTLASNCYRYMFAGCTSLVTAPELPATTLASNCYRYMFYGCTSLVTAPELPATTLASFCYQNMFRGCTSLVTAPELPATTLADYCYNNMFAGCTSLVNAPELPATTLASSCYIFMFYGCTKINTIKAKCMYSSGTTLITTSIGSGWLENVSSTGTFYKNPDWSGPTVRNSDTIPSGWTIVDWIDAA